MMRNIKYSRHVPKNGAPNKNIIRCMLLSIEERTVLSYDMCGQDFDEKLYKRLLQLLIDQEIATPIDNTKPIVDTSDLVILNYEKAEYYTKSSFKKCIDRIEKDLIPLLNVATASICLGTACK